LHFANWTFEHRNVKKLFDLLRRDFVRVQLVCGEAVQSHPRLALGVDAQEQMLPQIGGRRKLIEALCANEYGGQCGVRRPENQQLHQHHRAFDC